MMFLSAHFGRLARPIFAVFADQFTYCYPILVRNGSPWICVVGYRSAVPRVFFLWFDFIGDMYVPLHSRIFPCLAG
jgi:hypothetical protein